MTTSRPMTAAEVPDNVPANSLAAQRVSYIFVGKPGVGKSRLAEKLAASLASVLVTPEKVLQESLGNETASSPDIEKISMLLRSGETIPPNFILRALKAKVQTEKVVFKGFVLDGLPGNLEEPSSESQNSPPLDIQVLKDILSQKAPNHIQILVNLTVSDEDLMCRRAAQWLDPKTNNVYSGQQISYSRQRRAAGWVDGAEDEVAVAEEKWHAQQKNNVTEEDGTEEELLEQREELGDTSIDKPVIAAQEPSKLRSRTTWPILPDEVLVRLIKRPEDEPGAVEASLQRYAKYEDWIQDIRSKYFNMLRVIDVDATQHPETLLENLLTRIDSLGLSIYRAPEFKVLPPPEGGFRALNEDDIIRYWQGCHLEDSEPRRELSNWGKFCPVTFHEAETLTLGTLVECATYKGLIYFFATEDCRKRFSVNPEKYLTNTSNLKNLHVSVLGGPFSGKTKQAKMLANQYKLVYLNAERILSDLDKEKDQAQLKAKRPLYAEIVSVLRTGAYLSAKHIIRLFQEELDINKDKRENGWVMDGFPKTMEEIKELQASNLAPRYVVFLKNGINDVNIRARGAAMRSSSRFGKLCQNPDASPELHVGNASKKDSHISPDLEIAAYPNFDNLYNGFKEELVEVTQAITQAQISVTEIEADNAPSTIFSTLSNAVDPLIPKATLLTPKDIAELPSKVEFGATKDFCPVTLAEKKMLVKGARSFAAKYQNGVYYFISEEARSAFIIEPYNFIKQVHLPPTRIVFVGARGSGKTSLIERIDQGGAIHVKFQEYILEYANRLPAAERQDVLFAINEGDVLAPTFLIAVVSSLYQDEPFASQGFILEGFPRTRADAEILVSNGFYFDAAVNLKVLPEVACQRLLPKFRQEQQERLAKSENPAERGGMNEESLRLSLIDAIEKDINQLADVISLFQSLSVAIPVIEIDANKYIRPVTATLRAKLAPLAVDRKNTFGNPISISMKLASLLLRMGYKTYSLSGTLCPVTVKRTGIVNSSSQGKKPVIFGEHLYMLRDHKAKKEFMERPLDYVSDSPPQPIIFPSVCLTGSPKSGKTCLAKRVSLDLDLVYLTIPDILNSILDAKDVSNLHEKISSALQNGKELSDEVITDAIKTVTSRVVSKSKGWILDGYPNTENQALLLDKFGVKPHIMVHVSISKSESIARAQKECEQNQQISLKRLDVPDVVAERYDCYAKHESYIVSLFSSRYSSVLEMSGTDSKWLLIDQLKSTINGSIRRRQDYLEAKIHDKASAIFNIGLSIPLVEGNMGKFRDYCPVSYIDRDELQKGPNTSQFTAEYENLFYRMNGAEELTAFIKSPEHFVRGKDLPASLPVRRTSDQLKIMFPIQVELRGYCPVTLKEGKPGFESLLLGNHDNIVEHDGKVYLLESNEKLLKFMQSPWKYVNQTLPKKLPPPLAPISVPSLPIVGYLEQSVSTSLQEALGALGKFKPKYPYKSLPASASAYLGLYLKSKNPKAKEWTRSKFEERLAHFEKDCELMKDVAENIKACGEDFVNPDQRPEGLDSGLERLNALRG